MCYLTVNMEYQVIFVFLLALTGSVKAQYGDQTIMNILQNVDGLQTVSLDFCLPAISNLSKKIFGRHIVSFATTVSIRTDRPAPTFWTRRVYNVCPDTCFLMYVRSGSMPVNQNKKGPVFARLLLKLAMKCASLLKVIAIVHPTGVTKKLKSSLRAHAEQRSYRQDFERFAKLVFYQKSL